MIARPMMRTERREAAHPATGPRVRAWAAAALLVALALGCAPPAPDADPTPVVSVALSEVASGFETPVAVAHAGDASGRLFVVERGGLVRVVDDGTVQAAPYLDLSAALGASGGENGFLGLAFHPDFAANGRLFVHYVDDARGNVVAELQADPPSAASVDAGTLEILLRVEATSDFHVGGHLAFGPDGHLYAGLGDGGHPPAAQDLASAYGGLLRLDVDGGVVPSVPSDNPFVDTPGAFPYTWVHGLRNPWRFAFDAQTGDLWIADVGEDDVEEIDVLPAGSEGGLNYGWPIMEGTDCFRGTTCDSIGMTLPDYTYTHASGWGESVTGGSVYRGAAIPGLVGSYVFGDFISGDLFVVPAGIDGTAPERLLETTAMVVSFGVDEAGELLVLDYAGGAMHRLVPTAP